MEFLLSTYTFPLLVEILLLPFATLIAAMLVIAQSEKQFASVASFLGKLQVALGLIVIGATVWSAAHDFSRSLVSRVGSQIVDSDFSGVGVRASRLFYGPSGWLRVAVLATQNLQRAYPAAALRRSTSDSDA
jgi:hypothetical protein